ncbi:hypothetical protein [Wenjunlia tyrosinilytica]|jgi:hypothetical protein|uniref:Uncharacterized protein n=1 Tax=Wenjunlia tyrosinilytica TaxID=1544741 RepID=A0A918DX68_9ACTN|nr:hypothetical protein [Wenjunlia tyrosinilytica]GGO88844.1 hypothetical protein GCM10012280_30600 [Wenjunlia tyrosinilytica]
MTSAWLGRTSAQGAPPCDLVTVPARQGLEAVDILRMRTAVGPVLHDRAADTLGFVVPEGTAERWDLPGSSCSVTCPQPMLAGLPPGSSTGWLLPPNVAAPYTDPVQLRDALGLAAVTLAAADGL